MSAAADALPTEHTEIGRRDDHGRAVGSSSELAGVVGEPASLGPLKGVLEAPMAPGFAPLGTVDCKVHLEQLTLSHETDDEEEVVVSTT